MEHDFINMMMVAPMCFPLAWIFAECMSVSTNRLKNKGTEWDSGIHGLGTFYARMLEHLPVGLAGLLVACILTVFEFDALQYLPRRDFPGGLVIIVCGIGSVVLMIFGWRARLAREAYTEWKNLEIAQPRLTEVNGNLYRILRVYKDGRFDQDNTSPSERLHANQNYLSGAEQRLSKASRDLVIALVVSVVLWIFLAFVLSSFRHHPLLDATIPTALAAFVCAYPVGVWITASWDVSAHRGDGQYISAPRPIKEVTEVTNLKDISDAKPTGAAAFAPIRPAPASPPASSPLSNNPWETPQAPHQPPQTPHQPAAAPAPKYKNPFE